MIEVSNLTKRYAGRTAVSDISFAVARGEIVGLLGPNGAGKSTTMRILSCFMPATSGTVRVAGFDVFHESDEVRRRIGYMPENNPLYPEMRVREYLKFRARLKGLGWRRSRERVTTVMEQCGLADVGRRVIGQLSKGYRQRVGLADALVHEPDLIILDEPTIGLDPQQIRSVRQLIKSLAGKHTVLISTHILPEAEMMCSRMLIMFDGKILASDTPENLQRRMADSSQVTAEIAAPEEALRAAFEALPEVEQFDISASDGEFFRCALTPRDGQDLRPLDFRAGARARLDAARTDAQPPFAGGHLRANHEAGRRGGRGRMKIFLTLLRRELAAFFSSITGYVVIAAVTLLIGMSFVMLIRNLGADPSPRPVTELFFNSVMFWMVLILVTPVITMRLFALEKSSGTFETLMTTPVGDLQVVAAKFAAAAIFYMVMWLPTLAGLFVVRHFTNQSQSLDAGTLGGTCAGHFFERLPVPGDGLFRVVAHAQPDGGGRPQPGSRRGAVHPGVSGAKSFRPPMNGRCGCFHISICSSRWKILRAAWWTRAW